MTHTPGSADAAHPRSHTAKAAATATEGPATQPPAAPGERVSYGFFGGADFALRHHGAALPGVNIWDGAPDERHPVPVVLIHGTAGSAVTNWATLAPVLHNAGYRVFAPTYGVLPGARWPLSELGGLRDLDTHSVPEVAAFVDRVLEATGAEKVDLVGHSQGGLIAGVVAKVARPGRVRKVVTLAAPWAGVGGDRLTWLLTVMGVRRLVGDASGMLGDMVHGSAYLRALYEPEDTPYARDVAYTNIETRFDEFVVPHTSALLPPPPGGGYDVTNILLQHGCLLDVVDHAALPSDPRAVDFVLGALDPATAPRPRCLPSAPWVGGLLPGRISNALWRAPASTGGLSATGPDGVTSDGAGDPRAASTPPAAGTDGPESLDSRS